MTANRVLIFGLDGATLDLVRPWAAAGYLPNLARLMANGVTGELESTLPPVTSPAWPTFMTGCNPGKHGVFDFIRPRGDGFDLVNATSIRRPTIWRILSEAGLRVGVMSVPVTYPAQPVNGFLITGMLSPARGGQICYPADLLKRHEHHVGPYRIVPRVQYTPGAEGQFLADLYDLIDTHGRWGLHLMQHEQWDVFMIHFLALDLMQHALWRFMDKTHPRYEPSPFENGILDGYARVDAAVGRMLDQIDDQTIVLVMSDHGFGPLDGIVNLNNYLIDKGLLTLKSDPLTRLRAGAFRRGLTPATAFRWLARLGLQNLVARVSKGTRNRAMGRFLSYEAVDWSRTVAYSMGHVGQIYLNLAGREPQGLVRPADYETTLNSVIQVMQELRDQDGRSMITRLVPRTAVYHGPFADRGPDLHVEMDHHRWIAFPLFATDGRLLTQQIRGDSGCHRQHGLFLAMGPGIRRGETLTGAHIMDLAPTILHLVGLPVQSGMDGRVLSGILEHPSPVRFQDGSGLVEEQTSFLPDETDELEERLRSLGYL
jgi:predicted AlkP superfamily phosphohydrolase/phosphomutase